MKQVQAINKILMICRKEDDLLEDINLIDFLLLPSFAQRKGNKNQALSNVSKKNKKICLYSM